MKPFTKIQIPLAERIEVNSREGKLLNKAFWAAIAQVVKRANTMMESLLSQVNSDVRIWARGVVLEIYFNASKGDSQSTRKVVRHNLGAVPQDYVILDVKPLRSSTVAGSYFSGNDILSFHRSPYPGDAWNDTTITVFPTADAADFNAYFKILLLP